MPDLDLTHVHISRQTGAALILVLLAVVIGYLGFAVLQPFAGALLAGAILAVLFHPVHLLIHHRVKGASWAASLTTILVLILFLVPVALLGMKVAKELGDLYASLGPGGLNAQAQRLWEIVQGPADRLVARLGPSFGITTDNIRNYLQTKVGEVGGVILQRGLSAVGIFTGGLFFGLFSVLAFFFALRDGHRFLVLVLYWSPLGRRHTSMLFEAVRQTIFSTFYGVIVVAAAQGLMLSLGAWMTGLPSPLLWGVATAGASVLPLFGSALVWVPAALILFVQGSVGKGVFMLLWGTAVVAMVDNVLRPFVVTSSLPVNGFIILIAMLGGVEAFGISGILIGPMTVALIMALMKIVGERMHGMPERGAGTHSAAGS